MESEETMIQGMNQDTSYQMRERAIFAEAEANSVIRKLHELQYGLASKQAVRREEITERLTQLQMDTLKLMNLLNGLQLEMNI